MSTFRSALVFFDQLGVYDVVLPFLLIFSLVYAMLEKTKILGQDEQGGHKYTRKNLNSMVAFCVAFLVVASSQLVAVINATVAKVMVLLIMAVLFMIVLGSFSKDQELFLDGTWKTIFTVITFIGIALILLYNLGWLQFLYAYAANNLDGPVVGSFALLILILVFMGYVTGAFGGAGKAASKDASGGGGH